MNNKTILIYYLYVLIIIFGCGYAVFCLDASGWWFLLALILTDISPEIKEKE